MIKQDIDSRDNTEILNTLSNIVNFSDDAILTKSLEGIITSWNPGAQNIFGYSKDEVIGKHVSILIPPDRIDEEPKIIEKVKRGEYIDHYETERIRKDGSVVNILLSVSSIKDSKGNITGILKIARDITISKKAQEIQSRMSDIINFSDDAIITKTLEGIITSWNDGAKMIFGYLREEVIGKHISILIPSGRIDEEPHIIERITRGEYIDHYETERVRKDGAIIHISLTVSPIRNSTGTIVGVLKIARDISIKKEIDEIQSRLAAIINFSDDAIISKTLKGIITTWNRGAENTFGYTAEEVVGTHISVLIPPGRIDEELQIIEKIRHGEYIDHYETERVRRDGSAVCISLTVSPIKDLQGNIIGVSKIARDISERKKREEEIKNLNKDLEAFSYSVSHDLRAPLRSINCYTGILQEEHADRLAPESKKLISKILKNCKKMGQLIDDLLTFSLLGKQEMTKNITDMNSLVNDVVDEIKSKPDRLDVGISLHNLESISGDKNLLKQVWENLISNAVKYSQKKEKPAIEVGSLNSDSQVTYYVKDNGAGFDMKYADKLFNVFQRLHTYEDFEGTGIGLAMVQRIIAKHGGQVWGQGKVNEGATFYFSLPVSEDRPGNS